MNGCLRLFVGAIITAATLIYAQAPWGIQVNYYSPNCGNVTAPDGGCGCKWFNYYNAFVQPTYKFYSDPTVLNTPFVNLCIYGAMATIMLKKQWPDMSVFSGLDYNGNKYSIQHQWSYSSLQAIPCTQNPIGVPIPNCWGAPLCQGSDEITRLYMAAHTATSNADNTNNLLSSSNHYRLEHIFRDRLGYFNTTTIPMTGPWLDRIRGASTSIYPAIVLCSHHAFVIDGFNSISGQDWLHILNYATPCGNAPNAYWIKPLDFASGIEGYVPLKIVFPNPFTLVPGYQTKKVYLDFGDYYIRGTSNTVRQFQVYWTMNGNYRVKISDAALGIVFYDQTFNDASSTQHYTGWYGYIIPNAQTKRFTVELTNYNSGSKSFKMNWQDWQPY